MFTKFEIWRGGEGLVCGVVEGTGATIGGTTGSSYFLMEANGSCAYNRGGNGDCMPFTGPVMTRGALRRPVGSFLTRGSSAMGTR